MSHPQDRPASPPGKESGKTVLQINRLRTSPIEEKKAKLQSSGRKAPEVFDDDPTKTKAKSRRRAVFNIHEYQPKDDLLQRIRLKEGRSKESSVVEVGEVATPESQDTSEPCRGKSNDSQSSRPTKAAESKPILTRTSMKRALELKVEEQRSQMRKLKSESAEAEAETVFEIEPQLPGKLGATQAILERLKSEAGGQASRMIEIAIKNSTELKVDKGRATGHGMGDATSMLKHGSAKRSRLEKVACDNLINKGRSSRG